MDAPSEIHPVEMDCLLSAIAGEIAVARLQSGLGTFIVGLCGAQGSGKSTLSRSLAQVLSSMFDLRVAVISLDDLYLPSAARRVLARDIHPLFATRGVPGTHDIALGLNIFNKLASCDAPTLVLLPRFDKAADEPRAQHRWERFFGPADIVLFEGWCVGALAQDADDLLVPVNPLETIEDAAGVWRRHVNAVLGDTYQRLFGLINYLVLLEAPSFEIVYQWRQEQEHALRTSSQLRGTRQGIMTDAALRKFIAHYERLTRHILKEMPNRAELVIGLANDRRVTGVKYRQQ